MSEQRLHETHRSTPFSGPNRRCLTVTLRTNSTTKHKTDNWLPCKHGKKRNVPTLNVQKRYDEFQQDAVNCAFKDFQKQLNDRYLLVIPTGGGKTFTAVKAVNRLFEEGVLDSARSRILWTAHRVELLEQVNEAFAVLSTMGEYFSAREYFTGGTPS